MKIIVAIPEPTSPFPPGPAYVVASLKRAGFDVDGLLVSNAPMLNERLKFTKYDLLMTGGLSCCYREIEAILKVARHHEVPTVLGGGIVTSEPELIHRALRPDYSILGQGEVTAVELARKYVDCRPEMVPGTARLCGGEFVKAPPREEIKDLDALPFPDYAAFDYQSWLWRGDVVDRGLFSFHNLFDEPKVYSLVGSRSCPFNCTFCWHPSGFQYRCRSVPNILAEVEYAIDRFGVNIINIMDELFSAKEKRMRDFCAGMAALRRKHEVFWYCQGRVSDVTGDLLKTMKESGCCLVGYGLESYNQKILDSMKKRTTVTQIDFALEETSRQGLPMVGCFILGSREETPEMAARTLQFAYSQRELGIGASGLFAVPNSEDYRYAVSKGAIKDRLGHIVNHMLEPVNISNMSAADSDKMMTSVMLHRFRPLHSAVVTKLGRDSLRFTCPHCRCGQVVRNFRLDFLTFRGVFCRACLRRVKVMGAACAIFHKLIYWFTPRAAWPYRLWKWLIKMRKKKSHNPHISSRHLEFFSGGVGTGGGIEGARSEWS